MIDEKSYLQIFTTWGENLTWRHKQADRTPFQAVYVLYGMHYEDDMLPWVLSSIHIQRLLWAINSAMVPLHACWVSQALATGQRYINTVKLLMYRWFWKFWRLFFFVGKTYNGAFQGVFRGGRDLFDPWVVLSDIQVSDAQDNLEVKRSRPPSKNAKKCPIICFAPDKKKITSRTFKIRGTFTFLCPWERER